MAVSFTVEASLRGWDEMSIGAEFADGGLDGAECLTQWMGRVVGVCGESSRAGAQEAQIDLGGEQGRLQAEGSEKAWPVPLFRGPSSASNRHETTATLKPRAV